jgi:hypothetical protein
MEMRVESIPQKGGELCFGDVALIKGRFLIRIDSRLVWEVAIDILLHEVAHCVAWPHKKLHKERPDHSDEWGLAFARIYRRFHEEDGDLDSYEYPWKTVV